jgi:hypothetical protein
MVTQLDSPDGKAHKDPHRPSPSLVETDSSGKEAAPAGGGVRPQPDENPVPPKTPPPP